jgi:hypothetical protein
MKSAKKGIQKYHLWLLFFFAIFGGTFSMIIWTVKSAVNTPVYEDKSFMSSYQDVDDNYNQMYLSNAKFNSRYTTEVTINGRTVGMNFSDVLYGQRSLEKKSTNQNMLITGRNSLSISIKERESQVVVKDANVSFQLTRAIEDMYDINLNDFKFENNVYTSMGEITREGNWNIIGKIMIGEDTGYLYIKTNTKR